MVMREFSCNMHILEYTVKSVTVGIAVRVSSYALHPVFNHHVEKKNSPWDDASCTPSLCTTH